MQSSPQVATGYPSFADEAPQDERDVRRMLAEPAHEVRETSRGRTGCRRARDIPARTSMTCRSRRMPYNIWNSNRSDADAVLRRPAPGQVDHRGIVRGDRRIVAVGDQHLHHPRVGRVDVRLLLIGDRLRLAVRALDETDARAERVDAPEIVLAAIQSPTAARRRSAGIPAATASRRCRASPSVYFELSMSMRTKKPAGSASSRIFRRLSTALARSTSSPSCVSFSEMLRSTPASMIALDDVADSRGSRRPPRRAWSTLSPR